MARITNRLLQVAIALLLVLQLACTPVVVMPGKLTTEPHLRSDSVVTADGVHLPLFSWAPQLEPKAVFIALHGFNDYGRFIDPAATYWAERGIQTYAYDQRGFGATSMRGKWAGAKALVDDLISVIQLLRARHADAPLYIVGESMGGAVALVAMTEAQPPQIEGLILAAPAVWARETMPWYQRWALWLGAHLAPALILTGEGLGITPSDNKPMLQALGRDPLVIKRTRADALYGVTNLMDWALARTATLQTRSLILYGAHDDIIPPQPTYEMLRRLQYAARGNWQLLFYPHGYHMLLRDLQAEVVWCDILAWIESRPTPSGAAELGAGLLVELAAEELPK